MIIVIFWQKKTGLVGKFNWKPWLSTYGLSALDRINIHSSSNYVLVDYKTIVASNFYDLIDGVLENPINMNEFGDLLEEANVWTGTDEFGSTLKNCDHWQGGSEYEGVYGNTSFLDFRWTNLRIDGCGNEHHIYCIEDDLRD